MFRMTDLLFAKRETVYGVDIQPFLNLKNRKYEAKGNISKRL